MVTSQNLTIDDLNGLLDGTPLLVRWEGRGRPFRYTLRHIDGMPFAHKGDNLTGDNVQLLKVDDVQLDAAA